MALGLHPIEEALRDGIIDENIPSHKNVMNYPQVGRGGLMIKGDVGGGVGG